MSHPVQDINNIFPNFSLDPLSNFTVGRYWDYFTCTSSPINSEFFDIAQEKTHFITLHFNRILFDILEANMYNPSDRQIHRGYYLLGFSGLCNMVCTQYKYYTQYPQYFHHTIYTRDFIATTLTYLDKVTWNATDDAEFKYHLTNYINFNEQVSMNFQFINSIFYINRSSCIAQRPPWTPPPDEPNEPDPIPKPPVTSNLGYIKYNFIFYYIFVMNLLNIRTIYNHLQIYLTWIGVPAGGVNISSGILTGFLYFLVWCLSLLTPFY